jgi:hypothetical protein
MERSAIRVIETGTPAGDALGFTSDLFSGWLEMTEKRHLYLHYIISRHKNEGNTQRLLMRWLDEGYRVSVVMPRPIMQHILAKLSFVPARACMPDHYGNSMVDIWHCPAVCRDPAVPRYLQAAA